MYKDDLAAAYARVQQLEEKLKEKYQTPTPKPPKKPKPKGYWWGIWINNYQECTAPMTISVILGTILIFGVLVFGIHRYSNPRETIREQMCRIMRPDTSAVTVSHTELEKNERILHCEYFVPRDESGAARRMEIDTLDPADYME